MSFNRVVLLVLAGLYLAGCTTSGKVPVVTGGQKEPVYQPDDAINNGNGVYIKPQKSRKEITPSSSRSKQLHDTKLGVAKLLASAESYAIKKQYRQAQSTLERAQRIDPKEPKVYYELAQIHLKKGQYHQAEQMCKKGLSLSHGNPILQKRLWLSMAKALKAQGKNNKAHKAQLRAQQIKL